jgi:hypothetical protein
VKPDGGMTDRAAHRRSQGKEAADGCHERETRPAPNPFPIDRHTARSTAVARLGREGDASMMAAVQVAIVPVLVARPAAVGGNPVGRRVSADPDNRPPVDERLAALRLA